MQIGTPQILKALAFGLGGLAAIAAAVELSKVIGPSQTERAAPDGATDPLAAALARCRDLAPEDYARASDCRAAWEESRRRFLGLPPESPDAPITEPPTEPAGTE